MADKPKVPLLPPPPPPPAPLPDEYQMFCSNCGQLMPDDDDDDDGDDEQE